MLDVLRRMVDDAGKLIGVRYALVGGDQRWIAAVGLQFESLSVVLRAVSEDDTVSVSQGPLRPDEDESIVDATARWCGRRASRRRFPGRGCSPISRDTRTGFASSSAPPLSRGRGLSN